MSLCRTNSSERDYQDAMHCSNDQAESKILEHLQQMHELVRNEFISDAIHRSKGHGRGKIFEAPITTASNCPKKTISDEANHPKEKHPQLSTKPFRHTTPSND
ncbi:hypothetical protein ACH5RR_018186 [Cinchona calisaya]|uniref:Uncharacterized protein n=1 Tax=Cinchona calisaya TaxID=153742 RepID=A0ABD2ZPF6_9GENT